MSVCEWVDEMADWLVVDWVELTALQLADDLVGEMVDEMVGDSAASKEGQLVASLDWLKAERWAVSMVI